MKIKLILKFMFYFFGTFLHELAHYAAALLMGKPEGFSVCPKIEGSSFIYGNVRYRVRFKVLSAFISSAPLVWWVVLLVMIYYFQLFRLFNGIPKINSHLLISRLHSFSTGDALFIWLFIQMLWAGRLSLSDIRNVLSGIFSFSGIFVISVFVSVYYFIWNFLLK